MLKMELLISCKYSQRLQLQRMHHYNFEKVKISQNNDWPIHMVYWGGNVFYTKTQAPPHLWTGQCVFKG